MTTFIRMQVFLVVTKCPTDGWVTYHDACYKVHNVPLNGGPNIEDFCFEEDSALAYPVSIHSEEENTFIGSLYFFRLLFLSKFRLL